MLKFADVKDAVGGGNEDDSIAVLVFDVTLVAFNKYRFRTSPI